MTILLRYVLYVQHTLFFNDVSRGILIYYGVLKVKYEPVTGNSLFDMLRKEKHGPINIRFI